MLDIVQIEDGKDLVIADSAAPKAGNVLSIQIGDLEYAPDFGVDLRFFLQEQLQFQNESFRAYLVERLTQSQISVDQVVEIIDTFTSKFIFDVGDGVESVRGLIR